MDFTGSATWVIPEGLGRWRDPRISMTPIKPEDFYKQPKKENKMAKLICKDGTELEVPISDETEQSLREAFEPKKFEPIKVCHVKVYVAVDSVSFAAIGDVDPDGWFCGQKPDKARETIAAIQSAIDFIEGNR